MDDIGNDDDEYDNDGGADDDKFEFDGADDDDIYKMTRCTTRGSSPAHELWLQPKVAKADRKMGPPSPNRTPNLRFGHFLQRGGSKWTEVVLYEQGIPLGRSGQPTCLY